MMKKPSALLQLLDDLKSEIAESSVISTGSSSLILIFGDNDRLEFTPVETELLLHSRSTVEQLYDAIGQPITCAVELHMLTVNDTVMDALERYFDAVDET